MQNNMPSAQTHACILGLSPLWQKQMLMDTASLSAQFLISAKEKGGTAHMRGVQDSTRVGGHVGLGNILASAQGSVEYM